MRTTSIAQWRGNHSGKLSRKKGDGREIKKSNLEVIDEQQKTIEMLKMKVDKLNQLLKIKDEKLHVLEDKIMELQADKS